MLGGALGRSQAVAGCQQGAALGLRAPNLLTFSNLTSFRAQSL